MRVALLLILAACPSSTPEPQPPKRPTKELIIGDFARRPPDGEMAVRFGADGTFFFAKSKSELDKPPHLSDGAYTVEESDAGDDVVTFTALKGLCAKMVGVYTIVVSKIGIRFAKVNDACADRARLDGQTLWRL